MADIWTTAPDRGAVTEAADAIDMSLRIDPRDQGESRSGSVRILIVVPLAVLYDVREDDRLGELLSVRHVPVPPPSGD